MRRLRDIAVNLSASLVSAETHGVAFLDLHPVFAAHWAVHRLGFEFDSDGHWNRLGHSVVVAAIADRIRRGGSGRRNVR